MRPSLGLSLLAFALAACGPSKHTIVILEDQPVRRVEGDRVVYDVTMGGTNSHVVVITRDEAGKKPFLDLYAPQLLVQPKKGRDVAPASVYTRDEYLAVVSEPYREKKAAELDADLKDHAAVIYRYIQTP